MQCGGRSGGIQRYGLGGIQLPDRVCLIPLQRNQRGNHHG
jgi:hypothetical protein